MEIRLPRQLSLRVRRYRLHRYGDAETRIFRRRHRRGRPDGAGGDARPLLARGSAAAVFARASFWLLERPMFAVVRTGGKQYRVAAGDKIVVEKLAGEAGDTIQLGDILLAGEGSDLRSTDGLTVAAEIIAQAKADKVIVFKKRRRHNYR